MNRSVRCARLAFWTKPIVVFFLKKGGIGLINVFLSECDSVDLVIKRLDL